MALLAVGVAIGVTITATPAVGHVGGTVAHLWTHLRPLADARYVNVNEKARNADSLDGRDSAQFLPAALYRIVGDWTLGENDSRTGGKQASLRCDPGDTLLNGGYYTGTVNNPNHVMGSNNYAGNSWELEWWVPGGGSGGYVALVVTCLDTAGPSHEATAAVRPKPRIASR